MKHKGIMMTAQVNYLWSRKWVRLKAVFLDCREHVKKKERKMFNCFCGHIKMMWEVSKNVSC